MEASDYSSSSYVSAKRQTVYQQIDELKARVQAIEEYLESLYQSEEEGEEQEHEEYENC